MTSFNIAMTVVILMLAAVTVATCCSQIKLVSENAKLKADLSDLAECQKTAVEKLRDELKNNGVIYGVSAYGWRVSEPVSLWKLKHTQDLILDKLNVEVVKHPAKATLEEKKEKADG